MSVGCFVRQSPNETAGWVFYWFRSIVTSGNDVNHKAFKKRFDPFYYSFDEWGVETVQQGDNNEGRKSDIVWVYIEIDCQALSMCVDRYCAWSSSQEIVPWINNSVITADCLQNHCRCEEDSSISEQKCKGKLSASMDSPRPLKGNHC